jgi:hypothetical protein
MAVPPKSSWRQRGGVGWKKCRKNGGRPEVSRSHMFRKGRPVPTEPMEGTTMKFTEVVCWIISVCVGLRKSEVKTLAELVAAALVMPRVSLAELGRRLAASTCKTAKHCIKRPGDSPATNASTSRGHAGAAALALPPAAVLEEASTGGEHGLDEGAVIPHANAGHGGAWPGPAVAVGKL